ncbi:MAG: hypothetical protein HY964_04045 [Ignavibacteriales bacterium]|nr:hypothetical protein [Ignavibacteriales bacterium]
MKQTILFFKLPIFIIGILILSFNAKSQSQPCPLSLSVSYADIQQLTISDVDFEHFESRTLLFTLRIKNDSTSPVTAKLTLTVNIKLASGKIFDPAYKFSHDNLIVNPGTLTLTNMDLNRAEYRLNSEELGNKDEVKTNVQDVAMATGKFPTGRYSFFFTLENTRCGEISSPPGELKLENPTRVELFSPSDGETTSPFPLFEFFQDGLKADLTVAELKTDQSREDAIMNQPAMNKIEISGTNSYLYSGGRPLEDGKSYVWKVVSKISGPAGSIIEVPSPIGVFHVSNKPQIDLGTEAEDKSVDKVLKKLEEMFSQQYPELIAQLKRSKYSFSTAVQDDLSLSKEELLKMLDELQSSGVNINLSVE